MSAHTNIARALVTVAFLQAAGAARAGEPSDEDRDQQEPDAPVAATSAAKRPQLRWDPAWGKFGTAEYITTGTALGVLALNLTLGPSESPRRGGVFFDDTIRDGIRLKSKRGRLMARDVSDVLLKTAWGYPILVDALAIAAWHRSSPEVAKQMILINAEVIAITLALQSTANVLVSRERPYGQTCGTELPNDSGECASRNRFYSFFSGHTSQAFAAAAVTCMHHAYLPLYSKPSPWAPCLTGLAVATAAGTLRILGDRHYATDVLAGAAVGSAVGLFVPWFFHYRKGRSSHTLEAESDHDWMLIPWGKGMAVFRVF